VFPQQQVQAGDRSADARRRQVGGDGEQVVDRQRRGGLHRLHAFAAARAVPDVVELAEDAARRSTDDRRRLGIASQSRPMAVGNGSVLPSPPVVTSHSPWAMLPGGTQATTRARESRFSNGFMPS